jgi:hypothetical protein
MKRILNVYIFSCLLLLFCLKSKAQQGCVIGGRIYIQQTGTATLFGFASRPLYDNSPSSSYQLISTCPANDFNTYAKQGSQVLAGGIFSVDCGFTGDTWANATRGKVYNYTVFQCPLDDYLVVGVITNQSNDLS